MASYLDKTGLTYFWSKIKTYVTNAVKVTGIKGNKESSYRTGNVNITPENVGAISYDFTEFSTNPFADEKYRKLYISKIDNAFYKLDKRFSITVTSGAVANLFDGDYETQVVISAGSTWTIDMDFTGSSGTGQFPGYPYGEIFVSFYNRNLPDTITGRVYCNYEPHGIGWHDITFTQYDGDSYKARNGLYAIQHIEITMTAKSNNAARPVQIEMHLDRPYPGRNPFVSKYVAETLYHDLTAPNFIGNVNGTISGHTIAKDVPSNAVFTDTTYSNATTSAAGLMSSSDKSKLDGIASGAQVNAVTDVKVNGSSVLSNKVASVTVKDGFGQFQIKNAGGTISQQDIYAGLNPGSPFYIKEGSNVTLTVDTTSAVPGITIAATDTTYSNATTSSAGLMSAADKTALDSLAIGTVSDVQVNGTSVVSNSVANIPLASSSANGVMSSSQYTKLDGIEAGAEVNTVTDVQLNGTSILSNGVANIPIVSSSSPGAMSSAMNTKLSKTNVVFATTSSAASAAIKELTFGNTVTIENGTILMLQSTYTNSTTGVTFKKTGTAGSGVAVKYNGAGIGSSTLLYAGSASRISMYVFYDSAWHWIGWSYETNTTYSAATTSSNGLMSSSDKTKLNGIDTGAEVNQAAYSYVRATHSNGTDYIQWPANSKTEVFYVKEGSNIAFSQDDYTGELVISATDTTYSAATTSVDGLMSSADKTKLNGIDTGAEVNQNAFSTVTVGNTDISAGTSTDAVEFVAGANVTITPDATDKTITISATDTTYSTMSSSDIVTGTSTTPMVATPKAIHDAIESMINTALANVLTVTTS